VHAAGPTVRVELATEESGRLQAEITQEQQAALRLKRGEDVFVRPRQKRVFVEDYEI
jgi:sulfate transport system ATP-binding protein